MRGVADSLFARIEGRVNGQVRAIDYHMGRANCGMQPDSERIRALDSLWARSYVTHDTVGARALLADDIIVTNSNGSVKTKEGEIADIRPTPGGETEYFRTRDVTVKTYGDGAVATGLAEWKYTYNGRVGEYRRRYTAVFARGGPLGWRMVALHIGPAS